MRATIAIILVLLAGCQTTPTMMCESSSDCETPHEYLTRSSCPFTSVCLEGTCEVACPLAEPDSTGSGGWPFQSCTADSDCDCARYAASDLDRCACVDGACYALVRAAE